jgi:hypothetical protein
VVVLGGVLGGRRGTILAKAGIRNLKNVEATGWTAKADQQEEEVTNIRDGCMYITERPL